MTAMAATSPTNGIAPFPARSGCSILTPQGESVDAIKQPTRLTDAERIDRLRLIRSDNVGPRGIMAQTPLGASPSTDHLKGVVYARPDIDDVGVVSRQCRCRSRNRTA